MKSTRQIAKLSAGIFMSTLLFSQTACSLLTADYKNLKEPKVTLTGLNVRSLNPLQPSFLVSLKLDNPNDLDINLDGADVALALNGQPVAKGISQSPLTLKKMGSSDMSVEVTANTLNALGQLMALQSRNTLDYQVSGHLHLLNWLGSLGQLPFNFNGSVDRDTLFKAVSGIANMK
jgi:LEA14-like dessication related protein